MVTIFAIDRGKYKSVAGLDQVGPSPGVGLRLLRVRVGPAGAETVFGSFPAETDSAINEDCQSGCLDSHEDMCLTYSSLHSSVVPRNGE